MTEYVDKLFDLETPYGQPNLSKFGELVNDEMWWVVTEIVSEPTVSKRVKIMKQFIKVLKGDVHFYFSFPRFLSILRLLNRYLNTHFLLEFFDYFFIFGFLI